MDGGEEDLRGFVVPRCDCAELPELAEEVLDQMARLVEFLVVVALHRPVALGNPLIP